MGKNVRGGWLTESGRRVSEVEVEKVASQHGRDNGADVW